MNETRLADHPIIIGLKLSTSKKRSIRHSIEIAMQHWHAWLTLSITLSIAMIFFAPLSASFSELQKVEIAFLIFFTAFLPLIVPLAVLCNGIERYQAIKKYGNNRLILLPQGIEFTYGSGSHKYDWDFLKSIEETSVGFQLKVNNVLSFFIDKENFASQDELNFFKAVIIKKWFGDRRQLSYLKYARAMAVGLSIAVGIAGASLSYNWHHHIKLNYQNNQLNSLAVKCFQRKDYQQALRINLQLLEIYNNEKSSLYYQSNRYIIYRIISCKIMMNDTEGAKQYLNLAIKLDPEITKNYTIFNHFSYVYAQAEEYPEAEKYCRQAIAILPDQSLYHFNLGWLLWQQEKYEEATRQFKIVLLLERGSESKPENNSTLWKRAKGYLTWEHFDYMNEIPEPSEWGINY